MSRFMKKLMKTVKKETNSFAEKFVVASRGGAEIAAKQILEAASVGNQPSDILLGKVVDALRNGVYQTGQQMMSAGIDLVKGVGSPTEPSKSTEPPQPMHNSENVAMTTEEMDYDDGAVSFDESSKQSQSKDD